jgi:hypothetical protein
MTFIAMYFETPRAAELFHAFSERLELIRPHPNPPRNEQQQQQQQQQQPPSPSHPYRYFVFSQSNTTPNHPENLTIDTALKNPII